MSYEHDYEEIVKRFADPEGSFFKQFKNTLKKYRPSLTEEGIADLYHDSFIAAHRNLQEGKIKENTSWNSYLIAIGLNLASHEFRRWGKFESLESLDHSTDKEGNKAASGQSKKVDNLSEEETEVYNSAEVQSVLADSIGFMNDSCKKILELTLYERLSSEEIATQMGSTPRSIITRRNRCRSQLIKLVRASLASLGYEIPDTETKEEERKDNEK